MDYSEDKPRCNSVDPVWDRQCERYASHSESSFAVERLHGNYQPGDALTWGSVADVREAQTEREVTGCPPGK